MLRQSRHNVIDFVISLILVFFLLSSFDGLAIDEKKLLWFFCRMKWLGVPLPSPPPPPGRDTSSSRSYLQAVSSIFPDNSPLILLLQGGERYCESLVPWTRTQSSTTHVAFQLGSDKNNSQKSFLLFLVKLSFHWILFWSLWIAMSIPNIFFIKINSSSVNP